MAATNLSKASHVLLQGQTTFCAHCGERYKPNLPCSIDVFLAMLQAFLKQHRHCRKPEKQEGGSK